MKMVPSTPPPQRRHHRNGSQNGVRRRMLGRPFSARTAYWLMAVVVAVFAITVIRLFRHLIEMMAQP